MRYRNRKSQPAKKVKFLTRLQNLFCAYFCDFDQNFVGFRLRNGNFLQLVSFLWRIFDENFHLRHFRREFVRKLRIKCRKRRININCFQRCLGPRTSQANKLDLPHLDTTVLRKFISDSFLLISIHLLVKKSYRLSVKVSSGKFL